MTCMRPICTSRGRQMITRGRGSFIIGGRQGGSMVAGHGCGWNGDEKLVV